MTNATQVRHNGAVSARCAQSNMLAGAPAMVVARTKTLCSVRGPFEFSERSSAPGFRTPPKIGHTFHHGA